MAKPKCEETSSYVNNLTISFEGSYDTSASGNMSPCDGSVGDIVPQILLKNVTVKKPQFKKRKARMGKTPKEKIYWTGEEVSAYFDSNFSIYRIKNFVNWSVFMANKVGTDFASSCQIKQKLDALKDGSSSRATRRRKARLLPLLSGVQRKMSDSNKKCKNLVPKTGS